MKNKLLLSAISLSFVLMANVGHAGLIEDDFMVLSTTASFKNNELREKEKTLRDIHHLAIKTAEEVSDLAGKSAKSWWGWGSKSIQSSGTTLLASPSFHTKIAGLGIWGLGWGLDKFSDAVGDTVAQYMKNRSKKSITKTSNSIADQIIDYKETDRDVTSEVTSLS